MKKIFAMISAVFLCLILSIPVEAAQSEIGTTVPTSHSVSIEAEHASALYLQGTKGESDAYTVPRFSEPEFQIQVEEGYQIEKVLLNGTDVTAQLVDGKLKLSQICEDQVIEIQTKQLVTGEVIPDQAGGSGAGTKKGTESPRDQPPVIEVIRGLAAKTGDITLAGVAVLLFAGVIMVSLGAYRKKRALK